MPNVENVGMFTKRVCLSLMARIVEMMACLQARTTKMIACLQLLMARTSTTKVWLHERIVATLAGLQLGDNNGKQGGKEYQQR
jgi:hypothetical protein